MTREYIAIGPNCWGKADTRPKAVTQMVKNWPTCIPQTGSFFVYSCPPGSTVDACGKIVYPAGVREPFVVSHGDF